MNATIVSEYKNRAAFEKDAAKMAAQGYAVVTVTESQQRSGCMRIVLLNFAALLWKPPARLIVTYQMTSSSTI